MDRYQLKTENDTYYIPINECRIFMAMSTVPNAQKVDDIFPPYPDAPSIPICDVESNELEEQHLINLFEYVWSGYGQTEFECDKFLKVWLLTLLGALINYHTTLK